MTRKKSAAEASWQPMRLPVSVQLSEDKKRRLRDHPELAPLVDDAAFIGRLEFAVGEYVATDGDDLARPSKSPINNSLGNLRNTTAELLKGIVNMHPETARLLREERRLDGAEPIEIRQDRDLLSAPTGFQSHIELAMGKIASDTKHKATASRVLAKDVGEVLRDWKIILTDASGGAFVTVLSVLSNEKDTKTRNWAKNHLKDAE